MKTTLLLIALIITAAYCVTDWNKVLNNLVSIGIKNALTEGTLRTLYPLDFNSSSSRECCNKCNRRFELPPTFFTDDDASSQLGGVLAQVYNTNQLLVGISDAYGNESTLFTQYPNGTFGGILVDATQAIADQISFILAVPVVANITVIPTNNASFFDSVVTNLNNNTVQIFADVSYTFARSKQVDFTCFYSSPEKLAFYVNPDNLPSGAGNASSLTLNSFNSQNIIVAVTNGTIYEQAARELLPSATIVTYPNLNALYSALQNSEAQVTILPALNITVFNTSAAANNGTGGGANNGTSSGAGGATNGTATTVNVVQLNALIFEYGTGVGFVTLKAGANGTANNGTSGGAGGAGSTTAPSSSAAPTTAAPSTTAPTTAAPTTAAPTTAAPSSSAAPTTAAPSSSDAASSAAPSTSGVPAETTAAPSAARSLARFGKRNRKH